MSDKAIQPVLEKFWGAQNEYSVIGTRGEEKLGFAIEYAIHPIKNVGCFMVRFASLHSKKFGDFKVFQPRSKNVGNQFFLDAEHDKTGPGFRLNKLAFPVLSKGIHPFTFYQYCDSFEVWEQVAQWVEKNMLAEGFMPVILDLAGWIRFQFVPPEKDVLVEFVLDLPDLAQLKAGRSEEHTSEEEGVEEVEEDLENY